MTGDAGPDWGLEQDLGTIHRSGELIEILASRGVLPPRALGDPAVAVLWHLIADVDATAFPGAGAPRAWPGGARAGPRHRGRRSPAHAWPHAAAAAAVAAAVATLTAVATAALMLVGMFTRLTAVRGRPPRRPRY